MSRIAPRAGRARASRPSGSGSPGDARATRARRRRRLSLAGARHRGSSVPARVALARRPPLVVGSRPRSIDPVDEVREGQAGQLGLLGNMLVAVKPGSVFISDR